ncbi:MAG TPA: hypothetical protein VN708_17900 [Terriglobales bacterium]|jgi:hypothetical protein|nr:hypothetical protein [Terriglobales bacterium]
MMVVDVVVVDIIVVVVVVMVMVVIVAMLVLVSLNMDRTMVPGGSVRGGGIPQLLCGQGAASRSTRKTQDREMRRG